MRTKRIGILLTILISMVATKAYAYDIAVENEEGVTIYYNYINGGRELCVTYKDGIGNPSYSGGIVIPSEITTNNGHQSAIGLSENAVALHLSPFRTA